MTLFEGIPSKILATLIIDSVKGIYTQFNNPLNLALNETEKEFHKKYCLRFDQLKDVLSKHGVKSDPSSVFIGGSHIANYEKVKQYLLDNGDFRIPKEDPEKVISEVFDFIRNRFLFHLSKNKKTFGPLIIGYLNELKNRDDNLQDEIVRILPTIREYFKVMHVDHERIINKINEMPDKIVNLISSQPKTKSKFPGPIIPFPKLIIGDIDELVGRKDALEWLEKHLIDKQTPSVALASLHGTGGMGKTFLAHAFAQKHHQNNRWFSSILCG